MVTELAVAKVAARVVVVTMVVLAVSAMVVRVVVMLTEYSTAVTVFVGDAVVADDVATGTNS